MITHNNVYECYIHLSLRDIRAGPIIVSCIDDGTSVCYERTIILGLELKT